MLKFYLYLYLCSLVYIVSSQKVETSIKNLTEIDKAKPKKRGDDPIKKDIRKYLRECGADVSDEDEEKSEETEHQPEPQNAHWAYENKNGNNNKKDDKKNRGSYPTSYGENKRGSYPTSYGNKNKNGDDCEDNDEDDDDGDKNKNPRNKNKGKKKMYRSSKLVETFNTSHSNFENYRDRNNKRGNKKPQNSEDYDESDEDGNCNDNNNNNRNKYGNRNNNKNNNRDRNRGGGGGGGGGGNNRKGNNNRGGMGYGGSRYGNEGNRYGGDPYGNRYGNNEDFGMYDAWGGNRGYNIYGGRLMRVYNITEEPAAPRSKRQTENEDLQCLSQCVFGYMEMLDDNRVPSETEVIKYLQSNIQDGTKRMKTVREARRCFARLSTTDNDDGCKFSKALSKCMNLEIDGKT